MLEEKSLYPNRKHTTYFGLCTLQTSGTVYGMCQKKKVSKQQLIKRKEWEIGNINKLLHNIQNIHTEKSLMVQKVLFVWEREKEGRRQSLQIVGGS